jgi:hypothetical protein
VFVIFVDMVFSTESGAVAPINDPELHPAAAYEFSSIASSAVRISSAS